MKFIKGFFKPSEVEIKFSSSQIQEMKQNFIAEGYRQGYKVGKEEMRKRCELFTQEVLTMIKNDEMEVIQFVEGG